jgi:hypothetical protein
MRRLLVILFIVLLTGGCEKYKSERDPGYGLEFHRIKDFQKEDSGFKIINSSVTISDSVIIYYDEIVSYNPENYTFTVTGDCANRLNDFELNQIHGTPFAVTVNKQVIYTGYFWCSFSSTGVNWITIDPLNFTGKNQLRVSLGYPGSIFGDYIPDNRNDVRILDLLIKDGKLKE